MRPLVVTRDDDVLDDVLRLAAAARVDVTVATDGAAARPTWSQARLVLVGVDVLAACAQSGLTRREPIVVVGRRELAADEWGAALRLGADAVFVLPAAEDALVARIGDAVEEVTTGGRLVAVVGGCGGAGASVLAGAIAVTAARSGRPSLLVDLDPFGGGADLLVGAEGAAGLRWPDLGDTVGRLSGAALRAALPVVAGVAVLATGRHGPGAPVTARAGADSAGSSGVPMHPARFDGLRRVPAAEGIPVAAASAIVQAGTRTGQVVVADLPRALGEAAAAVVSAADLVVVVSRADVRACAATTEIAAALRHLTHRCGLVVRMPGPSRLEPSVVAECAGIPLVASLRSEPGLLAAIDRGEVPTGNGRGPLAAVCRELLSGLDDSTGEEAA